MSVKKILGLFQEHWKVKTNQGAIVFSDPKIRDADDYSGTQIEDCTENTK
jgi:hypothetical protein